MAWISRVLDDFLVSFRGYRQTLVKRCGSTAEYQKGGGCGSLTQKKSLAPAV